MKHSRITISMAACATVIACGFGAAPAQAAVTSGAVGAGAVATSAVPAARAAASGVRTSGRPVHVDSAAGAVYYTCVESNGSLLTVLYGQSVKKQCKGANAIQLHYETGQFIKTIKLTPAGVPGKKFTARPGACAAAIVGTAVLIIEPTLTPGWYVSSAVSGYGLTDCISQ